MTDDAAALELELWLDRREAALVPELVAHDRAVLARALADRDPPPPPAALLDGAWLDLPRRAARVADGSLRRRAATLVRWSLAARVAMDAEMRRAASEPRTLEGLARRHQALAAAAGRLGLTVGGLVEALYGASLDVGSAVDRDVSGDAERDVGGEVDRDVGGEVDPPGRLDQTALELPEPAELLRALAAASGVDPRPIAIHRARRALTIVVVPGVEIHCLLGAGADRLASLALAAHELGHGLRAAGWRGGSPTLAAPESRVADEAAAAWAVRALEDPAIVTDAAARAQLGRRRARRERITAALARFEARCLTGTPIAAASEELLAIDARALAREALFDEPGVMAAYAAADRACSAPLGSRFTSPSPSMSTTPSAAASTGTSAAGSTGTSAAASTGTSAATSTGTSAAASTGTSAATSTGTSAAASTGTSPSRSGP